MRTIAGIAIVNIIFMLFPITLEAATYYSRVATGNFATVSTWSVNRSGTPTNATALTAADIFIIQTGNNITLAANQSAASVTVESGGTLTMGGNNTITIPLITINSGGTFALAATRPTFSGDITNDGSITGTTARLTANAGTFTNNGTITLTTGRITRTTGSLTNSGTITMGIGEFTATTGSFTNTSTGTLSITGAATVTLGTGNFVNDNTGGSVNFGASIITVSGTADQSIGGFTTTGRFTASKTAGTTTITGDINAGGITKSGAGTLDMGSGTHTTTGTVILTAGTLNGGSGTINVDVVSTTAWQGTATVFVPGTSTVNFGAAGAQILSATGTKTFYNLTFSNSGLKTNASTTVNNIFSLEGTATASAAPTYGASATLRYNTSDNRTAGAEWPATFAATGGVVIDAMAITTNNSKTFNLNVPLTINTGATLTPASGHTFTFNGDLINDGTWTPSNGAVTITGTRAVQSIGSFSTSGLVTMSKSSGTATFTGDVDGGAFTMNGAGTLNLGTGLTHTFTGAWTNTAGTLQGNSSTLEIGGTGSGTGVTFTAGTSMVDFNGSGAQNIPTFTYYSLNASTGNTKTLLGNTTVANVLTINPSSTFATGAFTLTLSGTGTPLVNNGTFTATAGGTVIYSGATSTIAALTYYNLQTTTAGSKTLAGTTTVNNILTINSPSTLDLSSFALTLSAAGSPLVNNGTFTCSTSTVSFSNASSTNIPALNYYNLTLSGGPRVLAGSGTIGIANTFTPGGGGFTVAGSTVNFNGAAQTIPVFTFNDLILSGSGSKTILTATTVSANAIDIQNGPTLDLPGTAAINITKP